MRRIQPRFEQKRVVAFVRMNRDAQRVHVAFAEQSGQTFLFFGTKGEVGVNREDEELLPSTARENIFQTVGARFSN